MSTTSPIPPSIGRVVLVRSVDFEGDVPALVNRVHSNDVINACLFPSDGSPHTRTSLAYSDADEESSISWRWMDYQLKVAAERDPVSGEPTTA